MKSLSEFPARRDNLLLTPSDIMPSLLSLMGLSDLIPGDVEGADYSSIMLGKKGKRPTSALYLNCSGQHGGKRGLRQSCSAQGLRCALWGEDCPKTFFTDYLF